MDWSNFFFPHAHTYILTNIWKSSVWLLWSENKRICSSGLLIFQIPIVICSVCSRAGTSPGVSFIVSSELVVQTQCPKLMFCSVSGLFKMLESWSEALPLKFGVLLLDFKLLLTSTGGLEPQECLQCWSVHVPKIFSLDKPLALIFRFFLLSQRLF